MMLSSYNCVITMFLKMDYQWSKFRNNISHLKRNLKTLFKYNLRKIYTFSNLEEIET